MLNGVSGLLSSHHDGTAQPAGLRGRRMCAARFQGTVWLIAAVMLAGCGERPAPSAQPASSTATTSDSVAPPAANGEVRPSEVNRESIGLVHAGVPASLEDHAWDSEHLNESAGHELKALVALLENPETLTADSVAPVLDDGFQSTVLRPTRLRETHIPPLNIRRLEGAPPSPEATTPAQFAAALRGLPPGGSSTTRTTQVKIFGVSMDPPETLARIELVHRGLGDTSQQVAVWRCRWIQRPTAPPRLASLALVEFEETLSPAGRAFVDCTGAVLGHDRAFVDQLSPGLDHWVARIEQAFMHGPSGWEGMAMGDANGDGLDDLYVCQPGGLPNRLFIQNADGTLSDQAGERGVDWWDQSQAALFADLDNDGDQDIAVAMVWGVLVLANNGGGQFTPAAAKPSPEGMPHSMAAADYDADGDLDLYVCCYAKLGQATEHRFLARPLPYHDANNGGRNMLLRNDRKFRFQNATVTAGLDENNRRFSFAAAWEDFDGDGDLDLYVANDFGRNNLYRCDREGESVRFLDVAASAGVEDISAGMSASWGDVDNDGRPDLYVSNMWSSAGNRVAYQRQFRAGDREIASFQRHARGNSLFHNSGDGTFRDLSEPAGVTMGRWAWGSRFADLNNDGWDDLLVANGYLTQTDAADL